MNGATARFIRLGASLAGLVLLGWVLTGQAAKPAKRRVGLPTDWSHHHTIFTMPQTAEDYARVADEPRFWQQLYRREAAALPLAPTVFKPTMHRDWAINLGSGPGMGPGNYPAKYGFNVNAASCSDWVVYGTGLPSSSSQASIVAFTNLYTGCGGPTVNWAYNTAIGQITTSPVLSLDGTQIAFVQTNGVFQASVVLLKWTASTTETITSPKTLTSLSAANYATCSTPPCMTEIQLRDAGFQATDTLSSIFYDYKNDVAWVGDDSGWLHKFTPFFNGTPQEVTTSPWPLHVNTVNTNSLSSPVFDRVSGNVFIGDLGGFLYAISSTTGTVTQSAQLDFGTGIVDGPVVDSTHNLVYVFASSDGSGTCGSGTVDCTAVYQLGTGFAAGVTGTETTVGNALVTGNVPNAMYIGSFDAAYFSSTSPSGSLYVCGNTGANPTLYRIPITAAGVMPAAGTAITSLSPLNQSPQCSPVNDIPNPTGGKGGVPAERVFVSVQGNGLSSACASGGCIFNFISAEWQPSTAYVVGQQILDTGGRIRTVKVAGTSGLTVPGWGNAAGGTTGDSTVTWISGGALSASTLPGWAANHHYASNSARIIDTNGNIEVCTTNTLNTGATQPTWNTTIGGTTPDGATVIWTNAGPLASFALPSAGGTSGMIEDNVVSQATQAGASQVYFTTLGTQTCATSGSSGACAVQASQAALQ